MFVGSHVSIRGGYLAAAKTAVSIGANAFQFFTKNPRSLTVKMPDEQDAANCKAFVNNHQIASIVHCPYPVNLAVSDPAIHEAVVQTVRNDLNIADACGALGVVVHFGHYRGEDPLQGYKNILQCIHNILDGYTGSAQLLIENQAGGAPPMGTTLEELMQIRTLSEKSEYVGFCFDTCHAFASGLLPPNEVDRFIQRAREIGYLDQVKAVHLNDSVYPPGSGKDRHAPLGQGQMGETMLQSFIEQIKGLAVPLILETDKRNHIQEIRKVKQWCSI